MQFQANLIQGVVRPLAVFVPVVLTSALLAGCASTYKPESLRVPERISCVYLPEPMTFVTSRGMNSAAATRLEKGPYISERVDAGGTYYRAPPGGYSGWPWTAPTSDGGFWIPHNPTATPKLYKYASTAAVPPEVPSNDVNCSSFAYSKDPVTSKVSVMAFAAPGVAGEVVGGIAARSASPQSGSMSYGRAAAVGGIGGAAGMLIVTALINADVGKIALYPWPEVPEFEKLRKLAAQAVPLNEAPAKSARTASTPLNAPK